MRNRIAVVILLLGILPLFTPVTGAKPGAEPDIFPLSQVRPGMKGVADTIYSGDKIEQIDLTVIGVLPNAIAPRTSIILVQLEGPHAEESGVVAGMSGSPVYFDGKLAGAIALKLGIFAKQAIAGVMPIEQMLAIQNEAAISPDEASAVSMGPTPLPANLARQMGLEPGAQLMPIEVPLVTSGIAAETIARFSSQLAQFGFAATTAGGTAPPQASDSQVQPGDMVGIAMVDGDLSLSAGCTVTAIVKTSIFLCGHPLFGSGRVSLPMVRGHVVTTLNSSLESTKILTTGGPIGTLREDLSTAVMGTLGPSPATIPLSLEVAARGGTKTYHFELAQHPKLTPVLVGLVTFNALVSDPSYSDGTTLHLDGEIQIAGHPSIQLRGMFAPTGLPVPDGFTLAAMVQTTFAAVLENPFEKAQVKNIDLRVTPIPERRSALIEYAWSERTEARPGETVAVKVLLRPYRGEPFIREIPITIPPLAKRGTLRILVSDAAMVDQMRGAAGALNDGSLTSLDELIQVLNSQHQNDRLYVSLLRASPTLVIGDKRLPDVPPSALHVLEEGHNLDHATVTDETLVGEWSTPVDQVVDGQQTLSISVQ